METGIFAYNLLEIIKQIIVQKCYSEKYETKYNKTRNLGITVYDPVTQLPFTQTEIKQFQDKFITGIENIKRKSTTSNKLMVLANTIWLITMIANVIVSTCTPDDTNGICQNTTNVQIEANKEFYRGLPSQAIGFMQNIMYSLYIGATTSRIIEIWKRDKNENYTLKSAKTIRAAITGMYLTGTLKYLNQIMKIPLPKLKIGYKIPDSYLEYARNFVAITPENDILNIENMPRFLDYGGQVSILINKILGDKNDVDEMSRRIKRMKGRRKRKKIKKINEQKKIYEQALFYLLTGDSCNHTKSLIVSRAIREGDSKKQHLFNSYLNKIILKTQNARSQLMQLTNENLSSSSSQINNLFSNCNSMKPSSAYKTHKGGNLYSTIINPITGRKVSIFGKLGKIILKNYIGQISYMV